MTNISIDEDELPPLSFFFFILRVTDTRRNFRIFAFVFHRRGNYSSRVWYIKRTYEQRVSLEMFDFSENGKADTYHVSLTIDKICDDRIYAHCG